jgi:hypothetical protein
VADAVDAAVEGDQGALVDALGDLIAAKTGT